MNESDKQILRQNAEKYETAYFLEKDPSKFMHLVKGIMNQEAMAFIASSLSYGKREQFNPKIQIILEWTEGEVDQWIRTGKYEDHFKAGDTRSFYRLYTHHTMHCFFQAYQRLLLTYDSLGDYVRRNASDGFTAVETICQYFGRQDLHTIIPKNAHSACKRVCLFLRWMVRSNSPVDLGLWADFIDRRTLIMPLDTHILRQSARLGLLKNKTATMASARRLTAALADIFPDDPLKGDYALFGDSANQQ